MGRVRNIDEEKWSLREHEHWSISLTINVGVSVNAKGGDCWIVGLDNWFSLMSTIRD
jgi:hypothetical protein